MGSGEPLTYYGTGVNGRAKVVPVSPETPLPVDLGGGYSYAYATEDTLVKTGAGFLHSVTFAQTDAAPTAGSIILYDKVTEAAPIIIAVNFTTAVFQPYTLIFDLDFATGLYVGFTTIADIGVTVTYR